MPSLLTRARSTSSRTGGAKQQKLRRNPPPNKRRRLVIHASSTATEDDDDDEESASVVSSSVESSEHDNERDEDYREDEAEEDGQGSSEEQNRRSSNYRRNRAYSSASSSASSGSSASSDAASSSQASSHKPLGVIEMHAARRRHAVRRESRGTAARTARGRRSNASINSKKRAIPVHGSVKPRYTISPVKLLPSAPTHGAVRRNFQVHPDESSLPYNALPIRGAVAGASLRQITANSPSKNNPFKRFAGKVAKAVNNMNIGISGNARQGATVYFPSNARSFRQTASKHDKSDNAAYRLSYPLTRHASSSVDPSIAAGNTSTSTSTAASSSSLSRTNSFGMKRKRLSASASASASNTTTSSASTSYVPPAELHAASLQPLRRTRSIAKKLEEIGVPDSRVLASSSSSSSSLASAARHERQSRGRRASQIENDVQEEEEEEDDGTESVERSIAEMSLDEISEHREEEDEEGEESAVDEDDAWYLKDATSAQLHRLRKDTLLRLAGLVEAGLDHSDSTKDVLAKTILDARYRSSESTGESAKALLDSSVGEDEDEEETSELRPSQRRYSTRHNRRSSAASSGLASGSSTPRKPGRKASNRSKSFPQPNSTTVESSAGEEEDEDEDDVPLARRRTAAGHIRSISLENGRPRMARQGSGRLAERTPGRLRSGKLRASASTSVVDTIDSPEEVEEDETDAGQGALEEDEDEEDVPTPIARRTRHRRNLSLASTSSAGYGEDEEHEQDMRNREYRLRKVSLPRKAKRGSLVEVSDAEPTEEEGEDEDEYAGQVVEEEDEDEEEQDGDKTIEEISSVADEDDEAEEEDTLDHDEAFDLNNATLNSLLRHRRDDLAKLCRDRDLAEEGTKKDLATALLEWQATRADDNEKVDTSSASESSDHEDEEEEDEDFAPQMDTSMMTQSSVEGDEDEEGEEEEEEDELVGSSPAKSVRSDSTARLSTRKARNETKTQALAKLSNRRQSYDSRSQDKPLLLHSQDDLVHSKKVDTPPGSGDQQDNDLELDLESLNLLDKEIAPDKLKKGEKIGSGGFKDVYEGRYRNVKVALADIRGHLTENDLKELGLLRDLRHDNIVRFIGVSIPEQRDVPVTIVTELCSNGDLFDYVRNVAPPPLEKILAIMLNIARGVEYLHMRKPAIVHRDLKSSNVLMTARGVAKITDFGLARVRNSTRSIIKSLVGTVNWQAPELWVAHPRYNEKADVYSAGLVFWECLQWHLSQKRYPFEGMNEHAIYQEVGQRHMRPPTATMRRQWGGDILDLVERMWAQDPKERPHMSQVVKDLEDLIVTEKARIRASR